MKYQCKNCEKEFEREDVLLIQKKLTLTGPLGNMPETISFALCEPCAKELGYEEVKRIRVDISDMIARKWTSMQTVEKCPHCGESIKVLVSVNEKYRPIFLRLEDSGKEK